MHCTGLSQPLNQPCQGLTEQKKEKCPSGANCRTLPHPPWSQASQQKGLGKLQVVPFVQVGVSKLQSSLDFA